MRFLCIGGDRRQVETACNLKTSGHEVVLFGLPNSVGLNVAENLYDATTNSDAVILPLPVTRDGNTVNTPLTGDVIFLQDILLCRPKKVFGGIIKPEFAADLQSRSIQYYDYYESEALTIKNAVLTAEAAIAIAINCTDFSIYGSKALIIGYGRIGKQLSKYLKALGAEVTATSRSSGTLAAIEADGYNALKTEHCTDKVTEFDLIFNTAPSPIMNREFFKNCKSHAFVEDLATDSGVDLAAANEYHINAAVYGGLPGKHSPVSAASFIANEILEQYT